LGEKNASSKGKFKDKILERSELKEEKSGVGGEGRNQVCQGGDRGGGGWVFWANEDEVKTIRMKGE